jgi:hypothetical protein
MIESIKNVGETAAPGSPDETDRAKPERYEGIELPVVGRHDRTRQLLGQGDGEQSASAILPPALISPTRR